MADSQHQAQSRSTPWSIRAARRADAATIADLLVEGFAYEYGSMLRYAGGRRLVERIHTLPRYLRGVIVAVNEQDTPIGLAGLRTQEMQRRLDWTEDRLVMEELGIGTALLMELYALVSEPMPYQPRSDEAYIYSVVVTSQWRRRGVADGLLHYLHNQARLVHKRFAILEVMETNQPARGLYDRHGYTLLKRRRGLLGWLPLGFPTRLLLRKAL